MTRRHAITCTRWWQGVPVGIGLQRCSGGVTEKPFFVMQRPNRLGYCGMWLPLAFAHKSTYPYPPVLLYPCRWVYTTQMNTTPNFYWNMSG